MIFSSTSVSVHTEATDSFSSIQLALIHFFLFSLTNALTPGGGVDGLNLPSDAPLVVIQDDVVGEDDDDDDDTLVDNYPADPKLRKTHARKIRFGMKCEWIGCEHKVFMMITSF